MKTIIKYPNRKLYDKETSKYVSVPDLLKGRLDSFKIVTHRTNIDVTAKTLMSVLPSESISNMDKSLLMKHCISLLS